MSCEKCKHAQEKGDTAFYRWKTNNIAISGCDKHLREIFDALNEAQNDLVGKLVLVYDRYHFAVPLKGRITSVSRKDGAYQVKLLPDQHGFPSYMMMNQMYFHHQQCEIIDGE